jgi:hypothetical protein
MVLIPVSRMPNAKQTKRSTIWCSAQDVPSPHKDLDYRRESREALEGNIGLALVFSTHRIDLGPTEFYNNH